MIRVRQLRSEGTFWQPWDGAVPSARNEIGNRLFVDPGNFLQLDEIHPAFA